MNLHGRTNFLKEHLNLHEETYLSFLKLNKLSFENGFDLQVISGFRDYERQLIIWNNKASGKRELFNKSGQKVSIEKLSKNKLLEAILLYSAIPGFSRHHWGTEIDVYDAKSAKKDEVQLLPSESDQGGVFFKLHQWLDEAIGNNNSFGFFRPYENYNGGVSQEKWHLSFFPVSSKMEKILSIDIFIKEIKSSEILLKEEILKNPEYYFNTYVINTDKPPWSI
jgi:LAS superfamily LD-carboxypeptidase LdcB